MPKATARFRPTWRLKSFPPTTLRAELNVKIEEYLGAGVKLVWVVDPEVRQSSLSAEEREPGFGHRTNCRARTSCRDSNAGSQRFSQRWANPTSSAGATGAMPRIHEIACIINSSLAFSISRSGSISHVRILRHDRRAAIPAMPREHPVAGQLHPRKRGSSREAERQLATETALAASTKAPGGGAGTGRRLRSFFLRSLYSSTRSTRSRFCFMD